MSFFESILFWLARGVAEFLLFVLVLGGFVVAACLLILFSNWRGRG